MSEDVAAKARRLTAGLTREKLSYGKMCQLLELVPELVAEIERLRSRKSIPAEPVDFYSLEDVCKIRQEYETEIERLTEQLIDARLEILDEKIAYWHDVKSGYPGANMDLHEFLGMTWPEYDSFIADPRGWMRQKITEGK